LHRDLWGLPHEPVLKLNQSAASTAAVNPREFSSCPISTAKPAGILNAP